MSLERFKRGAYLYANWRNMRMLISVEIMHLESLVQACQNCSRFGNTDVKYLGSDLLAVLKRVMMTDR